MPVKILEMSQWLHADKSGFRIRSIDKKLPDDSRSKLKMESIVFQMQPTMHFI